MSPSAARPRPPGDPALPTQRTALAWMRTGLGLAGVCLVLTRLAPTSGVLALVAGLGGTAAAGVLVSVQTSRHRSQQERLRAGHLAPSAGACLALMVGVVSLAAVSLGLVLGGTA